MDTQPGTDDPAPHRGWHSRDYLPRFDAPGLYQALTFRLADSLPSTILAQWEKELAALSDETARDLERRRRIEDWLDAGHGSCLLRQPEMASLVQNALLYFDGARYRLLSWCVMPNHVHVLIQCLPGFPLDAVLHSWKSFSSHEINRRQGSTGSLWQREYHDRYIRDEDHYWNVIHYIHRNPVKARLVEKQEDWSWSSAAPPFKVPPPF